MNTGEQILNNLTYRIGQRETPPGSNRGILVDKVLHFVLGDEVDLDNLSDDDRQWCAGLYCLACHDAKLSPCPQTLSTGGLYDWCLSHGKVIYVPRDLRNGAIKRGGSRADILPGDAALLIDTTKATGFRHTRAVINAVTGEYVAGNEQNMVMSGVTNWTNHVIVRPYK